MGIFSMFIRSLTAYMPSTIILFTGDIILEVNGTTVTSADAIKPYLTTNGRHVALGYIPSGKPSKKRDKSLSRRRVPSEGSRVKRARTLHDRVSRLIIPAVILYLS